jgi:hypothetical protein
MISSGRLRGLHLGGSQHPLPQTSRPCGFSRASLTLVLGPHLFHMQLNEYELYYMLFVL